MKRILALLLIVLMLTALVACNKNDEDKDTTEKNGNTVSSTEGVKTTPADNPLDVTEPDKGLLSYTYEVPGTEFTIDMPDYLF